MFNKFKHISTLCSLSHILITFCALCACVLYFKAKLWAEQSALRVFESDEGPGWDKGQATAGGTPEKEPGGQLQAERVAARGTSHSMEDLIAIQHDFSSSFSENLVCALSIRASYRTLSGVGKNCRTICTVWTLREKSCRLPNKVGSVVLFCFTRMRCAYTCTALTNIIPSQSCRVNCWR